MSGNNVVKIGIGMLAVLALAGTAAAQETGSDRGALAEGAGLMVIGAGLALGLAAIGTGIAQYGIGAAVVGAVAEDPAFLGRGFILLAFVETILIFGFVGLILLSGRIPTL
ncbi:MAG TPA: V-type ATP synthase subunit K [Candidatus Thermoplasmatota archaeon]|nr:V-type ATP synthase subunit K [Candidatus Thermoplasmatota archaeon]